MRYSTFVPIVAAAATAFVIPDEATARQLALSSDAGSTPNEQPWQDRVPSFENFRSSARERLSDAVDAFDTGLRSVLGSFPDVDLDDLLPSWDGPGKGRRRHPARVPTTNLTVYQFIKQSEYTTRFAEIVDRFPDIVASLNATKHNVTVFVPTDKAFERIPEHEKPSQEFVEKVLQYHIVPGNVPIHKVAQAHTLPTALKEDALGGRPQRLRVSRSLFGLRINFFSKVVWGDLFAPNGVIHGVDFLLVPPFPAPALISHFPSKFSTLILAVGKTGLGKELHGLNTTGATIFAPTNWAFDKLGIHANAFLFNTEKGLGYLKALLKYHVVANETLYSDEYYGKDVNDGVETETSRYHVDLPTLLEEKSLNIDISRWGPFIDIKVNGHVSVSHQDIITKEGVIQVVNHILIPPHKHRGESVDGEEIEVEDLMERLEPYLDAKKGKTIYSGEL